jgi:manganese efflux pump family protein
VLALLLVAVALGLSNLAAAIGIGSSSGPGDRVRVAVVFGVFEAGMPLVGLALGHGVADSLGHATRWLGGAILIVVGGYGFVQAWRAQAQAGAAQARGGSGQLGEARGGSGQLGEARGGSGQLGEARGGKAPAAEDGGRRFGRLVLSGLALSIDNLAAGFALGAYHVAIVLAAVLIGCVSAGMSLAGLEIGARLGTAFGRRSEFTAGLVLIAVGAAMAAGTL